ncbi:hypothetical protein RHOSPDRAFT_21301 [Rhodotorula sp. JG-1b]|nr:hypothetical protein RHOSPDRAFT_21301 [Rhodotorula sp. JG-1b]
MTTQPPPVSVSLPTSNAFSALSSSSSSHQLQDLDERLALALRLTDAVLEHDDALVQKLVRDEKADCWVQDKQGWTALHAAAYTGNVEHVKLLLRRGNAVWALTDNLGCTAGDIAFSMNNAEAYEALLGEGVRAEMLRAVLETTAAAADEPEGDGGDDEEEGEGEPKLSTASDNATFLSSRLVFTHDASGQPVALDAEGNGVMMGWETGIMRRTAERLCEDGWRDRKESEGGKIWHDLVEEEEKGEREPLKVMNVGFGLGIIDTFLQEYVPTSHLIIEPHPDVLAFARRNGWYDRPGVRFYEGTWKEFFRDLEEGKEEYLGWDAIYFDTYSEHYSDLHAFFQSLPDLLSISDHARFSFFHGLGATSRLLYDVYTTVSELHLREVGLVTSWDEVDVVPGREAVDRWSSTGIKGAVDEKKYWAESMVGQYRLPVCRLGI